MDRKKTACDPQNSQKQYCTPRPSTLLNCVYFEAVLIKHRLARSITHNTELHLVPSWSALHTKQIQPGNQCDWTQTQYTQEVALNTTLVTSPYHICMRNQCGWTQIIPAARGKTTGPWFSKWSSHREETQVSLSINRCYSGTTLVKAILAPSLK